MISALKRLVHTSLPQPMVSALKRVWQGGRSLVNSSYFRMQYPGVTMFNIRRVETGQLNQPLIIDHLLKSARNGYFLDIGANHPEHNSNTHFFEHLRGYTGIAFDPMEKYALLWSQQRPQTRFMPLAVGAGPGQVRFFQLANTDGWADQLSFTELSGETSTRAESSRSVEVIAVADIDQLPGQIAFASIDVEGAESAVLQGFKASVRPQVLLVENCFGPIGSEALRRQILAMGYTMVGRISYVDDIYVRTDLAKQMPSLRDFKRQRADLFQ